MPTSPFSELLRRLKDDPEAALDGLFRRYADRLARLVRGRVEARFRAGVGASDVVQEALFSFFRRQSERPFELASEEALWGLLAQITLFKCGKMVRALAARKRGGGQVLPLGASDGWDVADEEPTPEEALICEETVAALLGGLRGLEQDICRLRLEGLSGQEIAERLNLTEETVSRKLRKVKDRLVELVDAAS